MNLDDHEFDAVAANQVRGGEQDIWTIGVNWYINNTVKAQLNYQDVSIERLNAAGLDIGQDIDQVSMRMQFEKNQTPVNIVEVYVARLRRNLADSGYFGRTVNERKELVGLLVMDGRVRHAHG